MSNYFNYGSDIRSELEAAKASVKRASAVIGCMYDQIPIEPDDRLHLGICIVDRDLILEALEELQKHASYGQQRLDGIRADQASRGSDAGAT
jgi:hypothetical protein